MTKTTLLLPARFVMIAIFLVLQINHTMLMASVRIAEINGIALLDGFVVQMDASQENVIQDISIQVKKNA
ncbi:MAG: hypothetical protein E6Q68_02635 [Polynucleobacter sp.]|nr:MAG: hypothetical protein E6Q68_02635 [Polynucleobacter sp.]